ncbi:FAD binding domain-containing protein [Streptomyces sp. CA-132043]|uniref:FAD binding domain-containing protein n=1 Tax=Streptomyces sp. CA-132043 TaxID=3240048 RepID=UPI003D8B50E7
MYAQGCSDLVAQFREGLRCSTLVALDRVPELRRIRYADGALRLGAGTDHHSGSRDSAVRGALPAFADAWGSIATHRIRQRATLGGNLMARRTRYELSIMLGALGARLHLTSAAGPSVLSPGDLWDRAEPPGALLHTVEIPDVPGVWFGYERSMRPLATVAVAVRGTAVTVSVGAEYSPPHTVRTTLGAGLTEAVSALPESIGDMAGSAPYRRHLAAVLAGRLLRRYDREKHEEGSH